LYSVQCSELGVDPEKLEKNLAKVLRRAERWKAILLLDEADVYIRERGEDIQHNAIVGVFLRVLEYYSGILFMTTNKLTENIDDAIISRCTAHLRYKNFSGDLLKQGWEVLSKQFEVELTKKDITQLCNKWKDVSGRSIKNLLKLTRKYASAKNQKPSADMVEIVSEYSPAFKK
jgi:SpoVK/Ycf46/Vps4 family AAA+-type ATPase